MLVGCSEKSVHILLLNMYNILELSGLFVYQGSLIRFSAQGETKKCLFMGCYREISTQIDASVNSSASYGNVDVISQY